MLRILPNSAPERAPRCTWLVLCQAHVRRSYEDDALHACQNQAHSVAISRGHESSLHDCDDNLDTAY